MPSTPASVAKDLIDPGMLHQEFHGIGQPEHIILLQQFTVATAPDIVQLLPEAGAHTQRPPLVQYPVDVGGQVTREATLLFGQSKPARDEKIFLRFRAYQAVLTGQL